MRTRRSELRADDIHRPSRKQQAKEIGKPVDRTEWRETAEIGCLLYAAAKCHNNIGRVLAENIADAGGLRLALMAFEARHKAAQKIDGFTPEQRFFLSFGLQYCGSATPEYECGIAPNDEHANARFRVNGVVSNMPEFRRAFDCKRGQPMVRENACRVW